MLEDIVPSCGAIIYLPNIVVSCGATIYLPNIVVSCGATINVSPFKIVANCGELWQVVVSCGELWRVVGRPESTGLVRLPAQS